MRPPSQPRGEASSADARCQTSDLQTMKGLLFQVRFVVICYDGLQKLTRTSLHTEEAELGEVT